MLLFHLLALCIFTTFCPVSPIFGANTYRHGFTLVGFDYNVPGAAGAELTIPTSAWVTESTSAQFTYARVKSLFVRLKRSRLPLTKRGIADFFKSIGDAFKKVGEGIVNTFKKDGYIETGLKDTFKKDGYMEKGVIAAAMALSPVAAIAAGVLQPVLTPIGHMLSPLLSMIPGEADFAKKNKWIPILGQLLAVPPEPGPINYNCTIKGGGPGMYAPGQLTAFNATLQGGVTRFKEVFLHSSMCAVSSLSDSEASFLNSAFASAPVIKPDEGSLSPDDEATFLASLCTMDSAGRKSFLQFLSTFPGTSDTEKTMFNAQNDALNAGQTPQSCTPPPPPPPNAAQLIAMYESCTLIGGGSGLFSPENLATFKTTTSLPVSRFKLMMTRTQLCSLSGMSDAEVDTLSKDIAAANVVKPESGCLLPAERQPFLDMLPGMCIAARKSFITVVMGFPGASKEEISNFADVATQLGCQQPNDCPPAGKVCRPPAQNVTTSDGPIAAPASLRDKNSEDSDKHQLSDPKLLPPCDIFGGGPGVHVDALKALKDRLALTMSPFMMALTRSQFCRLSGKLSDVQAKELNALFGTIKAVAPEKGAMTKEERDKYLARLSRTCVATRQNFLAQLKNWTAATVNEIQSFNSVINALGDKEPATCASPTAFT